MFEAIEAHILPWISTILTCILVLIIFLFSRGDSKFPTTWENKGKWKKKGSKRGWLDRKKEARGEAFSRKRFRRKKLNPKKSLEVARGRLVWQSKTEWFEKPEAWIPTLPKSNQTRLFSYLQEVLHQVPSTRPRPVSICGGGGTTKPRSIKMYYHVKAQFYYLLSLSTFLCQTDAGQTIRPVTSSFKLCQLQESLRF